MPTYSNLKIGTSANNTMTSSGTNGSLQMYGFGGNDIMTGASSYINYLDGGDGADTITGGSKDDELFGGSGNDTINGGGGVDKIKGDGNNDTLNGQGGADEIWGGTGNDTIDGGSESDILRGEAGADVFKGLTDGDLVFLGRVNNANDTGVDRLVFSGGNSVGTIYKNTDGTYNISNELDLRDFTSGTDTIDLRTVGGLSQSFIFDTRYQDSENTQYVQKSIFIGSDFVGIDFKGDNDYDIVISNDGNFQFAQSDFMLV